MPCFPKSQTTIAPYLVFKNMISFPTHRFVLPFPPAQRAPSPGAPLSYVAPRSRCCEDKRRKNIARSNGDEEAREIGLYCFVLPRLGTPNISRTSTAQKCRYGTRRYEYHASASRWVSSSKLRRHSKTVWKAVSCDSRERSLCKKTHDLRGNKRPLSVCTRAPYIWLRSQSTCCDHSAYERH